MSTFHSLMLVIDFRIGVTAPTQPPQLIVVLNLKVSMSYLLIRVPTVSVLNC